MKLIDKIFLFFLIIIILFMISPILWTVGYVLFFTNETFMEVFLITHWFLILTFPFGGFLLFILAIIYFIITRKNSNKLNDNLDNKKKENKESNTNKEN